MKKNSQFVNEYLRIKSLNYDKTCDNMTTSQRAYEYLQAVDWRYWISRAS